MRADKPADAGRDEVLVLVRFEHVERLFICEARMKHQFETVAYALLDRLARSGMRGDALTGTLRLGSQHRDFFFRERRRLCWNACDIFTREVDFQMVHA